MEAIIRRPSRLLENQINWNKCKGQIPGVENINDEDLTEELWKIAKSTPSKFDIMTIKDESTGLVIEVDQSLDSTLKAEPEKMVHLLNEFVAIYLYLEKGYRGQFDGRTLIKINSTTISFNKTTGLRSYKWLKKYVTTVLEMMEKDGYIDFTKIKEEAKNNDFKFTEKDGER